MQQESYRGLKFLVIALGIVLVGGTVFVFASLAGKAAGSRSQEQVMEACAKNKLIRLRNLGEVDAFAYEGKFIRVGLRDDAKGRYTAVIVDPCTNKVKSRVAVVTK